MCAKAAAIRKDGMRNAATAEAATLGYASKQRTLISMRPLVYYCHRVTTCDVVQHAKIEQRIHKSQQTSRYDRTPEGRISVTRERKPEQADREAPHGDERYQKSSFGPAHATSSQAIALVQVCLNWDEAKHDADTNYEVEVG